MLPSSQHIIHIKNENMKNIVCNFLLRGNDSHHFCNSLETHESIKLVIPFSWCLLYTTKAFLELYKQQWNLPFVAYTYNNEDHHHVIGGQRNKEQVKGKQKREEEKEKMDEKRWNSWGLKFFIHLPL